uniref:GTP-binding protein n=1 Tax=viral metagenome TaxID=1070528 RepID=A0A6C0C3R7_9ZZZZ
MSYDYLFKIIFIGDANVGKTALTERITKNDFHEYYNSTIGVDFSTTTIKVDDKSIKTHIWDTAGQDSFASIISTYYRGIAAAVIVFDVTRKSSFNKCSFWLDQININNGTSGYYPTLMLVGNKIDKSTRSVTYQEAKTFADKNNMIYYETSAKNNTNTNIFYQKLNEQIYNTIDLENINEIHGIKRGMISQTKINAKSENECCFCCTVS